MYNFARLPDLTPKRPPFGECAHPERRPRLRRIAKTCLRRMLLAPLLLAVLSLTNFELPNITGRSSVKPGQAAEPALGAGGTIVSTVH